MGAGQDFAPPPKLFNVKKRRLVRVKTQHAINTHNNEASGTNSKSISHTTDAY